MSNYKVTIIGTDFSYGTFEGNEYKAAIEKSGEEFGFKKYHVSVWTDEVVEEKSFPRSFDLNAHGIYEAMKEVNRRVEENQL